MTVYRLISKGYKSKKNKNYYYMYIHEVVVSQD